MVSNSDLNLSLLCALNLHFVISKMGVQGTRLELLVLFDNLEGWGGVGGGRRFRREGDSPMGDSR